MTRPSTKSFACLAWLARMLLLLVAYVVTGLLGLRFASVGPNVTLVWLSAGIALAAFLRWGPGHWPGVWLASLVVNLSVGSGLVTAIVIATGNTLGPLVGAHLLSRQLGFSGSFTRRREVLAFLLVGVFGCTTINATVGSFTLVGAGTISWSMVGRAWLTWWLGDAIGTLVAAPPLLLVSLPGWWLPRGQRLIELTALSAALLVSSWMLFGTLLEPGGVRLPLAWVPYSFLILMALRFEAGGAAFATVLISTLSIGGTVRGCGPFVTEDVLGGIGLAWTYVGASATVAFLLVSTQAEQKRAEQDWREREEHYRTLVEQAWDGIFISDHEGRYLDVNTRGCTLLGYTREEIVAMRIPDVVIPEEVPHLTAAIAELNSGLPHVKVWRFRRKDGSSFFGEISARKMSNGRFQGIVRDIDDRKKMEEENTRLRAILEATPDLVATTALVGPATYVNPAGRRLLGVGERDTVYLADHRSAEMLGRVHQVMLPTAIREGFWAGETTYLTRQGREVPVSQVILAHKDATGEVAFISTIARDVTASKRAEESVRGSRQIMEIVLNNIPQGVFWKDRESRYLGCNRVVCQALGFARPEDMVGKRDVDIPCLTPEQADFFVQKDSEVMQANVPEYGIVEPATLADGTSIWMETSKIPLIGDKGEVMGVLGTWQDITARKRTEEALQRSNQLLGALSRCQAGFISGADSGTTFASMLSTLLDVTGSEHGFIAEVLGKNQGAAVLRTRAITVIDYPISGSRTLGSEDDTLELSLFRSLADRILQTTQVVTCNLWTEGHDPGPKPPSSPLGCCLGLPLHRGDELIGMVGLANRPQGYDEDLVCFLEPFLYTMANLVVGLRNERGRREAEERIRDALYEKEALLKEIHHRVKNNLQIVTSLLNLQANKLSDQTSRDVYTETKDRIRTMALLHETLYRSENLARLDVRRYVTSLCTQLFRSYGIDQHRIALRIEVAQLSLDVDRAIPCGLIINELVSNALKYAFPDGRPGQLVIRLSRSADRLHVLQVQDDGIGLPGELDMGRPPSLGLQLVRDLTRQLEGELTSERASGTTFTITFLA